VVVVPSHVATVRVSITKKQTARIVAIEERDERDTRGQVRRADGTQHGRSVSGGTYRRQPMIVPTAIEIYVCSGLLRGPWRAGATGPSR
jgi:hypothetical protein